MLNRVIAVAMSVVGMGSAPIDSAFAQSRTEEDTLVVGDPTVAASGKWKVGGSVEYWRVSGNVRLVGGIVDADVNFNQPGFSLFAAYGDWTFQGTRRNGKGDVTFDLSAFGTPNLTVSGQMEQTDQEFLLRYLFRSVSPHFAPYILLGYTSVEIRQEYRVVNGSSPFISCVGSPNTLKIDAEYKGPLLGLGGIFPISRAFGVRADARIVQYSASERFCSNTEEGGGTGGALNLTGYYDFGAGFNLQLGVKYSYLNGGGGNYDGNSGADNLRRLGYFGMLGYSYNF